MAYAARTNVPVERTRAEIEKLLVQHKASRFMAAWDDEPGKRRAVIMFDMKDRRLRFELPLPEPNEREFRQKRNPQLAWAQACRQKWRALLLTIKAKLESVASGVESFEEAFLAHVVLPDGTTMGSWSKPRIAAAYLGQPMPKLLPGAKDEGDVVDGEVRRG